MTARWVDTDGHRWPITGAWCVTCGMPLHQRLAVAGQARHVLCDEADGPMNRGISACEEIPGPAGRCVSVSGPGLSRSEHRGGATPHGAGGEHR